MCIQQLTVAVTEMPLLILIMLLSCPQGVRTKIISINYANCFTIYPSVFGILLNDNIARCNHLLTIITKHCLI